MSGDTITLDADDHAELEERVADATEAHRENTAMRDALLRIIASDATCDTSTAMARNALRNTGMGDLSIEGGVAARRRGAT